MAGECRVIGLLQRSNLPTVCILAAVLALAFGLHFVQAYTAPAGMPPRAGDNGKPDFAIGGLEYPRHATDAEGHLVTITKPARKISSHYWSIDDFVYAVVPPENVISVSESAYDRSYSNVYRQAERYRPAIGTNAELVLKLNPDLILASSFVRNDSTGILRDAGVPVFRMFTMFTTLDQIARTILLTGYLTGYDAEARRAYDDFTRAVERAKGRKPAGAAAPRILGYRFLGSTGRYSYGDKTLFHDVVRTVGGINVGAENGLHGYDPISAEQLVRWNPEWIVANADVGQSATVFRRLLDDPAVRLTIAAEKRQLIVVEHNAFVPMSPFTILLLNALSEGLYPAETGT